MGIESSHYKRRKEMKSFMKKISAIVVALAMTIMVLPLSELSTVLAGSNVWDGTADATWASTYTDNADTTAETFTISTAEQLAQLAVKVNGGLNFTGKTINLTADIVLNDTTGWQNWGTTPPANAWTRIGFNGAPFFGGTFDGKGYTVSGIYINKTGTDNAAGFQGLFGYLKGTVKNVGVINSYIKGYMNNGGVVGQTNAGTVTNCYNEGIVIGTAAIGGVVGWSYNSTVTNCYNTGTVSGTSNLVGGVVGENQGSAISNSYNIGTVSGATDVGGVAGINYGTNPTITNCYYYGYNVGIGGNGASQDGTTPFVKITDNPLGTNKTTTITEQTTSAINTSWTNALGVGFAVAYSNVYTSSDTSKATVSGITLTGVAVGNADITGRTLTITQNELTPSGFTGATKEIVVPISMPLSVTEDGGGTGLEPTVTSVTVPENGTYSAGQNLEFTVNFDKTVSVNTGGGTPYIALTIGSSTAQASYISGSGTSTLVFRYTIQTEDIDADGIAVGTLTLNGGTINSFSDNTPAILTLNSVGSTTEVLVSTLIIPTVTTQAVSDITQTTATGNGNITALGSSNVTSHGICWNTTGGPTTSATIMDKGAASATGTFTANLTDLTPNTTYYVRAYATNSVGTAYGGVVSFTTLALPTDTTPPVIASGYPTAQVSGSTVTYKIKMNEVGYVKYQVLPASAATPTAEEVKANLTLPSKIIDVANAEFSETVTNVPDGSYKLVGIAIDSLGNHTDVIVTPFTVNTTATTPTITIPNNITLIAGNELSGITVSNAGYIYFVKSGQTATSYDDLVALQNNNLAEKLNYMSIDPTEKLNVSFLGLGVYDIYVVNIDNFLIAKSNKTLTITTATTPTTPPVIVTPPKTVEVIETPAGIDNADKIKVEPMGEAFDESVEVRIKDDTATKQLIEDFIKTSNTIDFKNATVFPLDISLYLKGTNTKVQPNSGASVKITVPIPTELLADKNSIKVVCVIDGKMEVLETTIIEIDGVYCVQFTAKHFSPYAIVVDKTVNTPSKNPQTGDNSVGGILLVAITSLSAGMVSRRKHKYRIVK